MFLTNQEKKSFKPQIKINISLLKMEVSDEKALFIFVHLGNFICECVSTNGSLGVRGRLADVPV
ncbi:hypothetical protein A3B87_02330 [Candidatus Kuenenbacteria bacterium RIFCSPHIGHO2_02_FULL_39_13]|uniref:Uncharacterized protein n=1 Tax=Candidatus Kuenenbacteria bacterium RIFCSPHIGHO2_02_FULL_39_13 TaxID=1798561 RepID=A0A1F6FP56_9BACT|nr:MAG: hypothetical protein A3B87_02330 [Candidatus Kuenenbacteria bacterium RIFCSPHIGHO2_02_FULL_39_13]